MERTLDMRSAVCDLISSTNLPLPCGAHTYPGGFYESAAAYAIALELGIEAGVARGMYTYMFSPEDCMMVHEHIRILQADLHRD